MDGAKKSGEDEGAIFDVDNTCMYSNEVLVLNGGAEAKVPEATATADGLPPSGHFSPQQSDPFSSSNFGSIDNGSILSLPRSTSSPDSLNLVMPGFNGPSGINMQRSDIPGGGYRSTSGGSLMPSYASLPSVGNQDLNLGAMGSGPLLQGRMLQGHDHHYAANAGLPLLQNAHHRNDAFHFTSQSSEQPPMFLSSQNTMISQSMSASSLPSTVSSMPRSNSFGGGNSANPQLPPNTVQQSPRTGVNPAPTPRPWHNATHEASREAMMRQIIVMLQNRKPDANSDWKQKLPQMARRLEGSLYSDAESFDQYNDNTTLKVRLQKLAVQMGARNKQQQQQQQQPASTAPKNNYNEFNRTNGSYSQLPASSSLLSSTASTSSGMMNSSVPSEQPLLGNYAQSNNTQAQPRQFINMAQINPFIGKQSAPSTSPTEPEPPMSSAPASTSASAPTTATSSQPTTDAERRSAQSEDHKKQVLKQQQQRLLLLRHASKCNHDVGTCRVTPHCASMKNLWKHIMSCKDQECKVAHCVSSRYVLSHYSKCKDPKCPVCGPVREAIRSNIDLTQRIIGNNSNALTLPEAPRTHRTENPFAKLDTVSSASYCMTSEEIQSHIKNIHEGVRLKASDIREICIPLVEKILNGPNGYIFANPVDPVALNIPDYFTIIKMPMDLGTVRRRLDLGMYREIDECAFDVRLTFDNAMKYNPKGCEVHQLAKVFKKEFDVGLKHRMDVFQRELEDRRSMVNNCPICGELDLKFEPPVFYCNGRCGSQRIRRNAFYYVNSTNTYHWCNTCYNELKENAPLRMPGDVVLYKRDLTKKKHSEDSEESWVQCDCCERWVHWICSLFNGRRNISAEMPFVCATCCLQRRQTDPKFVPQKNTAEASQLPHSVLSEFIEQRVHERLEEAYVDRAEKLGISVEEVEKCPQLTVRQVSSMDKAQPTREGMLERYKHKNYPSEFPCRVKCIVLFQKIDGQDVLLFGMYVYEYGHKCPQPNQRRVYISYLDSVHYLRPRCYRTIVYHEILVAYLEYVKRRGFHTCHIWACPPLKGDDYILYCHPPDQKTPKDDRLRLWYVQMLEKCKKRGIVLEVTDIHTEYMADPANDATVLPYFEGEYWCGEAENIIKKLTDNGGVLDDDEYDDDSDTTNRSKRKIKSKTSKSKRTRTSRGSGTPTTRSERDPVIAKLASIIEPMKEAFFVARLHPREYAEECARRREEELANEVKNEVDDDTKRKQLQEEALRSNIGDKGKAVKGKGKQAAVKEAGDASTEKTDSMEIGTAESKDEPTLSQKEGETEAGVDSGVAESKTDVKAEVKMEAKKGKSNADRNLEDTEDVDDTQDSEHFETRQAFLNLCQGNHYQFDQLRRAKHSSLMVLYHLHNPDAPKFIHSCNLCNKDILSGYRYNCETCDVDFCPSCYTAKRSSIHIHPLRPMVVSGNAPAIQLTEEQRRERNRSIQLHLQLLLHAASCSSKECKSKNCVKMKDFLQHVNTCKVKSGCSVCKRIVSLLNLHARSCRNDSCSVPQCAELKKKMRDMALKQQQMDDRRRVQMNEMYSHHGSSTTADG